MSRRRNKDKHASVPPPQHVIYRNLGANVSPECMAEWNWQVELHEGRGFPSGIAWVIALPPGLTEPPPGWIGTPELKFLIVVDDSRRRGLGMRLIEVCRERWPNIRLSMPISTAGEALCEKAEPLASPERVFSTEFINSQVEAGVSRADLERMAVERHRAMNTVGASEESPRTRPKAAGQKPLRRSGRAGRGKVTPT